jgi:hypothetical protein
MGGPPPGGAMVQAGPGGMAGPIPGAGPMQGGGGAHGPIGATRNPIMQLVIGAICGFYLLYLLWVEANEIKAFRGKDDINPIMFFVPILGLIEMWKLPEKILEAKHMAGVPNPQVQSQILYLILWPYFLSGDLNEIWQAAGGGQQPY